MCSVRNSEEGLPHSAPAYSLTGRYAHLATDAMSRNRLTRATSPQKFSSKSPHQVGQRGDFEIQSGTQNVCTLITIQHAMKDNRILHKDTKINFTASLSLLT
jgi:hypothetical protein